jgi:hypothetical protein
MEHACVADHVSRMKLVQAQHEAHDSAAYDVQFGVTPAARSTEPVYCPQVGQL